MRSETTQTLETKELYTCDIRIMMARISRAVDALADRVAALEKQLQPVSEAGRMEAGTHPQNCKDCAALIARQIAKIPVGVTYHLSETKCIRCRRKTQKSLNTKDNHENPSQSN